MSLEVTGNVFSVVWSGSERLYWDRLTPAPRVVHLLVAPLPPEPLME